MAVLTNGTKDSTIATVIIAVVLATLLSSLVLAKKETWLIRISVTFPHFQENYEIKIANGGQAANHRNNFSH